MKTRVSVVIPSYSRSDWLIELLTSLSYDLGDSSQYEVIVVDDGSPNGDEKEARILKKKWSYSFQYFRQENKGPGAARNYGVQKSSGEYIVFLDDDTAVEPGWSQEIIQGYVSDEIAGIAGNTITYQTNTIAERFLDHTKHLHAHQFNPDGTLAYICTANCSFRRSAFEEIGGFNEKLPLASGDDMDLGFRLRKKGYSFTYNHRAIVKHRQRESIPLMLKLFFISGRGAFMCANIHKDMDKGHVTSSNLFEPGKVLGVCRDFFRKIRKNFHNPELKKREALVFPALEVMNHFAYQFGRLYENFIARTAVLDSEEKNRNESVK